MNDNSIHKFNDVTKELVRELLTKYADDLNITLGSHLNVYQLNYQEREILIYDLLKLAGDLIHDSMILGANSMTELTLTAMKGGTRE